MLDAIIQAPAPESAGFIGRIPVRNIWLLLLYASQLYRELPDARRVELETAPDDIPDLVAELLANAAERRMRRNLTVGYRRRADVLNRVRGRIDLLRTERRQLLQRGQVACAFDELTIDTPRNRCVREALLLLARVVKREPIAQRCRELAARLGLAGVQNEPDARRVSSHILRSGAGWTDPEERRMLGPPGWHLTWLYQPSSRATHCWQWPTATPTRVGNCTSTQWPGSTKRFCRIGVGLYTTGAA